MSSRRFLPRPSSYRLLEFLALGLLMLLAFGLRYHRLVEIPPGLHFDEAIDLRQALNIREGARPLYVAEGWGREALYYYLVALVLEFVPYNPLALRVTAILCSLGVLLATHWLVRRWHSPLAALLTVGWLAVTCFPIATGRFGARHVSLPLLLGLAVLAFWWAWKGEGSPRQRLSRYAVAGLLVGLMMYTYQPARFMPFIFIAFALYLVCCHRTRFNLKGWLLWGLVALAVTLPLLLVLQQQAGSEVSERAFTIEPATRLLQGDPGPVFANTVATLKVFTIAGDPLESYNVPGRPIFVPAWSGLPFYIGIAIALWRWRKPQYAFALLWLFFSLLPTILTLSAPNFNRMIASQVPIMFLAAFPLAEVAHWLWQRWHIVGAALAGGFLLLLLTAVTISTWQDYFFTWPAILAERQPWSGNIAAVADYLEHEAPEVPVTISSRNIEDAHPYTIAVSLDREDLEIRWVDSGQALALPASAEQVNLIVTADRWLDQSLIQAAALETVRTGDHFSLFLQQRSQWPTLPTPPAFAPLSGTPSPESATALTGPFPYSFCACTSTAGQKRPGIQLNGLSFPAEGVLPGENLTVLSEWQTFAENRFVSLAAFVHLLNSDGEIVAQQDGLGYPPHTWRRGDRFLQVHHLQLDPSLPAGVYWLQLGLYERETGQRWIVLQKTESTYPDRLLFGPIQIGHTEGGS